MQEETEVLGENLRGQVWIENQIHIRLWPDWESNGSHRPRILLYSFLTKREGLERDLFLKHPRLIKWWITDYQSSWTTMVLG